MNKNIHAGKRIWISVITYDVFADLQRICLCLPRGSSDATTTGGGVDCMSGSTGRLFATTCGAGEGILASRRSSEQGL